MADLTKLTVNGETYTIKDPGAIRTLPMTVAHFQACYMEDMLAGWTCSDYTAAQLTQLLRTGPVIAAMYDENERKECFLFCGGVNGDIRIYDSVQGDCGWTHDTNQNEFFVDRDKTNKVSGNELWVEY